MKNEPAFPSLQPQFDNIQVGNGMTLRDYFAGQVLIGMIADPNKDKGGSWTVELVAVNAYVYAAAMLAEKEKIERVKHD